MDQALRHRIRYRLSQLQPDSEERLFEQVSAKIAQVRIHANIQISGGIAGHGDKGRDFENIPGHDPSLLGPRGRDDGLRPEHSIVGACTLGRSDPPGKVHGDVRTIHGEGPKPDAIYHFCEPDFPSARQTELRTWCRNTYGTALHIITGSTLADWLCEDDLAHALDLLGISPTPPSRCILPPVDTEGFVGRDAELDTLREALIDGEPPAEGRIIGVYGPPGVGKSGLTVRFARQHRERFPDGVVGIDLRAIDDPLDAVARLAVAFGEPLQDDEQTQPAHQIAQQRLAHRRCLVLLDNLEHGAALKQLRPGGRAALLITCRNQDILAQFAVPAKHRLALHRLPRPDAINYLRSTLGADAQTDDQLDRLADALRDLPLALRIGARRLLEDPIQRGRIDRFLSRLDKPTGLGELRIDGEADLDLLPLFMLSIEPLSDHQQHAFACLSVCAAAGFDTRAAAAAADLDDPLPLLARLARLSLLEVDQATGRFRFHALVDDFARLLAHRLQVTAAARERHARAMADLLREHADAEGEQLAALITDQDDIRHGLDQYATFGRIDLPLLQALTRLVEQTPLGAWHSTLLADLRERVDPDAANWLGAVLLLQQGKRDLALGRLDEARDAFERSLAILRDLKDVRGEAMVLNSLGGLLRDLGRLDDARNAFERSLAIRRDLNDARGEAIVLNSLGWLHRELGEPESAVELLTLRREIQKRLALPLPDFLKGELKMLRKWCRQLSAGTHCPTEYHMAMEKRHASAKDWPGAIIHMRRNLVLDPDGPDIAQRSERLAFAYFRAGRYADAIDAYRSAAAKASLSPVGHANFGRSLHLTGEEIAEAKRHLGEACRLHSNNPWAHWAHSWLGLVLADLSELEEAEIEAQEALKGHEQHAVLLHNHGQVLAKHPDERRDKLEQALRICAQATAAAAGSGIDFPYPDQLAAELRSRLHRDNPAIPSATDPEGSVSD